MERQPPQWLEVGDGPSKRRLAYLLQEGTGAPVVFLGGFRSDMRATKAEALAEWARDTGASPRTVARLFRQELGSTFTQWRQQVILARAVALAAGRKPINQIAAELGYNSPSAFSAMVRRAVGLAPGRFLGSC